MDLLTITKLALRVAGVWSALRLVGHVLALGGGAGVRMDDGLLFTSLFGLIVWLLAEWDWYRKRR